MKRKRINIQTGTVFNQLTFIKEITVKGTKSRKGLFQCSCGATTKAYLSNVRYGRTVSCGCKQKADRIKHGCTTKGTKEPTYTRWTDMRNRCNNEKMEGYSNYGGRGITICKEWDDYIVFKDWALNNGFHKKLSLDRKDNNKSYSPNNCRWVDKFTQCANKRKKTDTKNKYIGIHHTPSDTWVAVIDVKRKRITLGTYPTENEAVEVRNAYIKENNLPHTLNFK